MVNRRQFCKGLALGSVFSQFPWQVFADTKNQGQVAGFGPLHSDPRKILNLPKGFSYQIMTVKGQEMSDGLRVPGWPDGIQAFASDEGGFREKQQPGQLELFSEPNDLKLMRNADNMTMMPSGDLLICEDDQQTQRITGLTRQGQYYVLAANPCGASEFVGPAFSPDGSVLFINMQQQGGMLAIRGPWHQLTKSGKS